MKIISKYKDFYDSYGFITGEPDENIVYIRSTSYHTENGKFKNIIKQIQNYCIYNSNGGYSQTINYRAHLNSIIVGIYPYIYICPFYIIVKRSSTQKYKFEEIIDIQPISISEEYTHNKKSHNKIYDKINSIFNEYCKKNNIKHEKLYITEIHDPSNIFYWSRAKYQYTTNSWKIESPDIFKSLESPVFIYTVKTDEIAKFMTEPELILNPIIVNEKFNILGTNKARIINEQSVYTDIENFLWEIKKEPESTPDNNTKIINTGFDLKTSFRNIK